MDPSPLFQQASIPPADWVLRFEDNFTPPVLASDKEGPGLCKGRQLLLRDLMYFSLDAWLLMEKSEAHPPLIMSKCGVNVGYRY